MKLSNSMNEEDFELAWALYCGSWERWDSPYSTKPLLKKILVDGMLLKDTGDGLRGLLIGRAKLGAAAKEVYFQLNGGSDRW